MQPLMLVTWSRRLAMNQVDETVARQFIRDNGARHAPEDRYDDGKYTLQLKREASIVSDLNDTILCPMNM
jgi:hypothetical protein